MDKLQHKSPRLISLDAFRGLTILGMLLVNNTALDSFTPRQLTHAEWNGGVSFADMVFPWFLFIVGVAIPYAAASYKRKGLPTWRYVAKAFSRAGWLLLLGILVDSTVSRTPVLGLGVLQLIALAYLVGALLYNAGTGLRIGIAGALLVGYWALIRFVPIPEIGAGYFEPERNIVSHINSSYLSAYHLKGLISVIPTSALVVIGSAIGDLLRNDSASPLRRAALMGIAGIGMMGLGLVWNLDLPFNKPFWTPSYILFTAGVGSAILAAFYAVIDAKGVAGWCYPLIVFGSNAILAYVLPILVKVNVLQGWSFGSQTLQQYFLSGCKGLAGPIGGGWMYTASYIVFWWIVLLVLYRRRIFLRV